MSTRLFFCAACLVVSLLGIGCAPAIGDECETALDCSQSGSRICDRTQPGGYCTIQGCERHTCPEDSVCVKFRPGTERLAITYCMATCESSSDCREDEGYQCTSAAQLGAGEAEVLDRSSAFCSIPPLMISEPDDSEVESDAAMSSDDDAGR